MDITSLIEIVIAIAVIYIIVKFIVSPVIKIVGGIIFILILIYLLQRFFGFSLDQMLAPFGISLNLNKWALNLGWLLAPINYFINQIGSIFHVMWGNVPKS